MNPNRLSDALLTDFYQLTMAQAYWRSGVTGHASFSLFFRRLPPTRAYLVFAGLESILAYLEDLKFSAEDLDYLEDLGRFDPAFLEYLAGLRFTGQVRAMPEGAVCFPNEPVLEVSSPVIEAQVVETFLLNQVTFQTNIASKTARVVNAADGRPVYEFGARRTHGADAAMLAARCGFLAGQAGTSNVKAAAKYRIRPVGTMAHSFVMAFEHEIDSFRAYAASFPDSCTLLVDTYDTLAGVRNAIQVARDLARGGHELAGVRIDSGDLGRLAAATRSMLDDAGLQNAQIVVSGGLDEYGVDALVREGWPIDAFGVGTKVGVSADAPYLDSAYKLVDYFGRPVLKLSADKATMPGCKQVFRLTGRAGEYRGDVIGRLGDTPPEHDATELLEVVMSDGRRTSPPPELTELRQACLDSVAKLPEPHRRIHSPATYPVTLSDTLKRLQSQVAHQVTNREQRKN